jgi:hypothetical protein
LCDCIFSKYNNFPTNLGNVEIIFGFANFEGSQVKSLGNLQSIGGFANFEGSQVKSLGNLQSIGNDAYFNDSQVKSLGNLQSIGGDTYFNDSQITSLDNLQTIGGNVRFQNSQFESLGNLQSIGGNAYFDRSQVKSLGNLQSIGDNAYFQNSQFTSLGNLQSIGGNAIFKASQIKLLGNLQSIGRNADFRFSQITSLGNLQSIGGDAKFEYAKVTSLGNLQSIGGTAYFQRSQVESLGNLQTIRGDTFFGYSQIKSLGNLQTIGGDAFFGESQIKSLGNLQTIGGDANFINSQIKSLGNLQTIGGDGRFDDKKLAKEFTILKTKPNIRKELNYAKGGQTPQQSKKISKVMSEFNSGTLKTPQGKRVTNRKQAVAIALSEAGLSKYAEGGSMPTQPTQQQEPNYVSLFYNYLEKQKLTLTERDLVTRREAVSDWALGYIIYLLDESEYLLNYISKRVDFGNAKEIQKYQFIKGFITRYLTKNASFFTNEKYSEQYKNLKFTYFLWLEYYSSLLTEFSSDINLSIIEAISSRYFQAGKEEFNLTDDIDPYELFFAMINGAMWESRRMLLNAKNETQYAEQIYEYKILLNAIPDTSFETKKILTDRIKQIGDAHKEAVLFDAKTYFNVYCNTICVSNELREKNRFLREFFGAKNRQDINSENFKSWFGNSKVSENGIPLEVYHGTSHNEFTKWNMNLFPIAYFAENEDYSKFFQGNEGTMYKCYLRVQNPIDLRLFGTELVKYEEFVGYMKLKYGYELPFQPMLKAVSDARGGLWAWVYLRNGVNWLNHIKNEGYFDGFKYYENNPQDIVNGVERVTPAWAVFYPNQIKMAHGNALFNNTSDDIRFEEGGLLGE